MRVYNGIPVFVGNLIGYFSGVMTFAVIMERRSRHAPTPCGANTLHACGYRSANNARAHTQTPFCFRGLVWQMMFDVPSN